MDRNIEQYTRYNKITETFCYFPDGNSLKFVVKLKRKNKENEEMYFHRETKYIDEDGSTQYNMNLNVLYSGWQLGKSSDDMKKSVFISVANLPIVRYHLDKILHTWYLTDKSIYKINDKGNLILQGRWKPIQIPFNDYSYISFMPIVIKYEDGKAAQGCRLTINSADNYVDLSLDDFMTLYMYLNADIGALIGSLINYIGSGPKGMGIYDMGKLPSNDTDEYKPVKNFFTK
jgi:hypothetical protein